MKKRNLFKGAAALALSSLFMSGAAFAQDVTLRLHQFLPPPATVPKMILKPWGQMVGEASDGRIKIEHFDAMSLGGSPPSLMDQAIDGSVDMVMTVVGYTPGRFPRTEVFELPFTMTNAEAVSKAYWTLAEESMLDADFKDFKVIGVWVHGPGLIHSKAPITSIGDLNGVKLRAPTRVTNIMFKGLGATPVGMPVPAVPEALSKGVIDATVIPWEVTGALKVPELVQNHTTFGDETLYTTSFIFAMNKDRYNALPDDLKAVIDANSGLEFSAFAGKQMQADDEPSHQAAIKLGNNIIELSAEQVAEWKAATEQVKTDWVADMDAKGLDGSGLYARAMELIAQFSN
jgi:TRAP-type C4-dicarboxylate transport system substrate-binding protein